MSMWVKIGLLIWISLKKLENNINDKGLLEKFNEAKVVGKHHLATYIFNKMVYL